MAQRQESVSISTPTHCKKELRGHNPHIYIHVFVSDIFISHDRSAYSAAEKWTDPGNI